MEHKAKSLEEVHGYWIAPPANNAPQKYAKRKAAKFVSKFISDRFDKDIDILEIGCNAGANLSALWDCGFVNLTGIEINAEAAALVRPEITVINSSIEDAELGKYDLIFTKAVFCHIHCDSEWIFEQIAGKSNRILTIEDEKTNKTGRHFARNYRDVFEGLGKHQIEYIYPVPFMNAAYKLRLFQ